MPGRGRLSRAARRSCRQASRVRPSARLERHGQRRRAPPRERGSRQRCASREVRRARGPQSAGRSPRPRGRDGGRKRRRVARTSAVASSSSAACHLATSLTSSPAPPSSLRTQSSTAGHRSVGVLAWGPSRGEGGAGHNTRGVRALADGRERRTIGIHHAGVHVVVVRWRYEREGVGVGPAEGSVSEEGVACPRAFRAACLSVPLFSPTFSVNSKSRRLGEQVQCRRRER